MTPQVKVTAREVRRRQTRERILGAAIVEFTRSGMTRADVNTIVASAGVAHGTFFFHFPSKEHVLLELESREEARIATELATYLEDAHGLAAVLTQVVELVAGLEQRLGPVLFKELLALHFSPTRPTKDDWSDHPEIGLAAVLTQVVELVAGLEQRLGPVLFKELLALHFSPTRPTKDDWSDHP